MALGHKEIDALWQELVSLAGLTTLADAEGMDAELELVRLELARETGHAMALPQLSQLVHSP